MVRLDRISTGTGDGGSTSLADGRRVGKSSPRVCAYGSVDELNCLLGMVRQEELPSDLLEEIVLIQNDLFDLGADLSTPFGSSHEDRVPRIEGSRIGRLDRSIETSASELEPLSGFVLPGGSRASGWLHLARAVARRAEREVVTAVEAEGSSAYNPLCLVYLNRLSDLCFVWARLCNDGGKKDLLWQSRRP